MPDSPPSYGGPGPYDGWDLEDLLSGKPVRLPEGMRRVAATLTDLRAAPVRAELAGEAAARAAFRATLPASASRPGWPGGGEHAPAWPSLTEPAPPAGDGPHVVPRPRHSHRRPPRRGRWRSKTLAGAVAGAAVAIVGGIALAGGFAGAGRPPGPLGASSSAATTTAPASHPGSNGLEGTAAKVPTAHPTPTASGGQSPAGPGTLCRQYWAFFAHHESAGSSAAEQDNLTQLSKLAGSPWNVPRYCMAYYSWGSAPPASGGNPGGGQGGGPGGPGNSKGEGQPKLHPGRGELGGGNGVHGNNPGPGGRP
jgi:hypothetical protein